MRMEALKILMVTPEIWPFSKTGGLADVSGALSSNLKELGCDIRVFTPFYSCTKQIAPEAESVRKIVIKVAGIPVEGNVRKAIHKGGVPVYFIENDHFFERPGLYGNEEGDYPDNLQRFSFLCRSALDFCGMINFNPHILHVHDWQASLAAVYKRWLPSAAKRFESTVSVLTIHNLAYQGIFDRDLWVLLDLPKGLYDINWFEFWGSINLLKGAISHADIITTVSKKYSLEIQTREYGAGLEGVLAERKNDIYGILNGVDYTEWNPENDRFLVANYSAEQLDGKRECKRNLLETIGLSPDLLMEIPLLGMISRLVDQKGLDILIPALPDILKKCALVILGTGDIRYHDELKAFQKNQPDRMAAMLKYDEALAHKIEAGCDIYLMPSKFEPCGLNQMYSLKYGTVPVVRATGGLDDTIRDVDSDPLNGNGFKFQGYTSEELIKAVNRALKYFENRKKWKVLMRRGMKQDYSWSRASREYVATYKKALDRQKRRHGPQSSSRP